MRKTKTKILSKRSEVRKAFPKGIENLEIGSGSNPEPGYVHLDIQANLPDLDILSDVRKMPIPDNYVSGHVRAVHIMEHFCHPEYAGKDLIKRYGTTTEVLKEVYRVLKPGGKFLIVTPDLRKIAKSTADRKIDDYWTQRWFVGGHNDEYDVHHWLWTKEDAYRWFAEAGFKDLREWNPITTKMDLWKMKWSKDSKGNKDWHKVEWYHWLFFEGTK